MTAKRIIPLFAATVFLSTLIPKSGRAKIDLTGFVCGEDLNGDGYIEETKGELAQCIDGVCPVNAGAKAVDCEPVLEPAVCPAFGSLDPWKDMCWRDKSFFFFCPAPYLWVPSAGRCEMPPLCPTGIYDPAKNACIAGEVCPLDESLACADLGNGKKQCSQTPCVNGAATPAIDKEADHSSFQDDGEIDADGQCSGSFLIFNGDSSHCQKAGWDTAYFNCCDDDKDKFWFIEENCDEPSIETVAAKISERAVYVGEYCQKEIDYIGCVQKAKTYCLFSSKLARIIQEQGRPQLERFGADGGWGTAEDSNCGGFTPEEFHALDFSQIDFSEFLGDIETKDQSSIEADMKKAIDEFSKGK